MNFASIKAIAFHLPERILGNDELEEEYDSFPASQIYEKTGIRERRIAKREECASDLAFEAAETLLSENSIDRNSIDTLIFCTQTPDYFLPTSACILQDRLKLNTSVAAMDINLGCSGYVYSLGIAKGLIETGQAKVVLLLTADTYSKLLHWEDRNVRSIFGDAGAATLIVGRESDVPYLGPFVYGTDGEGACNLIVESGGFRKPGREETDLPRLDMNGPQIFHFTLKAVPRLVDQILDKAEISLSDVDLFVFHQANRFMLEHLREKIGIPEERFLIAMDLHGNTVSASIPIALRSAMESGRLKHGMKLMLVGFGVGYSWGATIVEWNDSAE